MCVSGCCVSSCTSMSYFQFLRLLYLGQMCLSDQLQKRTNFRQNTLPSWVSLEPRRCPSGGFRVSLVAFWCFHGSSRSRGSQKDGTDGMGWWITARRWNWSVKFRCNCWPSTRKNGVQWRPRWSKKNLGTTPMWCFPKGFGDSHLHSHMPIHIYT